MSLNVLCVSSLMSVSLSCVFVVASGYFGHCVDNSVQGEGVGNTRAWNSNGGRGGPKGKSCAGQGSGEMGLQLEGHVGARRGFHTIRGRCYAIFVCCRNCVVSKKKKKSRQV